MKNSVSERGWEKKYTLLKKYHISSSRGSSHYYFRNGELSRGDLPLPKEIEEFLDLYLPFCFVPIIADKRKFTYCIAHFAQTLDGKIATHMGHSQWIGNKENLIHAHRMRALCDAIIIGASTLERDHPKLTVRHVEGNTPARVVIGNGDYDFSCMLDDESAIYQISAENHENSKVKNLNIDTEEYSDIDCQGILKVLYEVGIKSVYIEGGSYTTSRFLEDGTLDKVQLHIAPLIVGSGISNFTLPIKDHLDQSIQFKNYQYFNMGSEIMFQGDIKGK